MDDDLTIPMNPEQAGTTNPQMDGAVTVKSATGQQIGMDRLLPDKKYEIGKVVARGGMGAIIDTKEATIERQVAMKVMLNTSNADDLRRFITEAKITGQLEHPSVVPVHDLGVDDNGQPFYTMKMVRGITLRKVIELLAEGEAETVKKFSLAALLTIFQKVCDAIAFAHSKCVIHRDLKPENIMLDDFGVVLVMDWGLAKVIGQNDTIGASNSVGAGSIDSTMAGSIMGTPQYMSPEQARGEVETLDARSDIYALGAMLYHVLALRPSVMGNDAWDIVAKVSKGEVEPIGSKIQDSLVAVVRKAMAFDKSNRYANVEDFQRDLAAYQAGFATRAENAGVWKQMTLLVRRHKALFTTAVVAWIVISTLAVWFVINLRVSERKATHNAEVATANEKQADDQRNRAEQALADLRSTAPNFIDQAATLITANDLPGALKKATAAATLAPDVAEYRIFRAHLLFAIPNLSAAADEYRRALILHPGDAEANEHLALCEELLMGESDSSKLTAGALNRIHGLTVKYGRHSHAVYLLRELQSERKQLLVTWWNVLESHGIVGKFGVGSALQLNLKEDGTFYLKPRSGATELLGLKGMPISELDLNGTKVVDLRSLANLPLRKLKMGGIKPVSYEPLAGMKLEELDISGSGVESLAFLRGMALRIVSVGNNDQLKDISPLHGMPLEELNIGVGVIDLTALEGMPLKRLTMFGACNGRDLSPLTHLPLEVLSMGRNNVLDWTPLRGMKLKALAVEATNFRDVSILAGMPLERLNLSGTRAASLDPLVGAPLIELNVSSTEIANLSPLREISSLKKLSAINCRNLHDLTPLSGLPLEVLRLHRIPGEIDLSPLGECPNLRVLTIPLNVNNVEKLRGLAKLEWLSDRYDVYDNPMQTVADFWKEYDMKHKSSAPK